MPNQAHVLFAFAPTMDVHDRFFNCYPSSLLHAIAPLVAAVDENHLDASYCDRIYHPKVLTEAAIDLWRTMLNRESPTHVAISSTYDSWHVALLLSQIVREVLPNCTIIHGGPHLDEVLEPFVLRRSPGLDPFKTQARRLVDFAVAGDGEYALLWLVTKTIGVAGRDAAVRAVAAAQTEVAALPGAGHIVFHDDLGGRVNLRFRNPLPLDSLPFVPRHLLPVEDLFDFDCFRDDAGQRKPTVTMITHRGCRARCNFCSEGLPYTGRSHAHILAEAERLADDGVTALFLDDSTIQDDPDFPQLLAAFHRLGFDVGALTRFDRIQNLHELAQLRELGLVYLYASVEQYSDDSLQLMHKRLRTEQIDRGVSNCRSAGVALGVSLLFGLPYEAPRSVQDTLEYVERLSVGGLVEYVSMSLFSYHPKTPLGQMNRELLNEFDFNGPPPNLRQPFTGFEEGSWYHPPHVTEEYASNILDQARRRFGSKLVRELAKHRGTLATVKSTP